MNTPQALAGSTVLSQASTLLEENRLLKERVATLEAILNAWKPEIKLVAAGQSAVVKASLVTDGGNRVGTHMDLSFKEVMERSEDTLVDMLAQRISTDVYDARLRVELRPYVKTLKLKTAQIQNAGNW